MYLRRLEKKDAPLMLEWMHDESVVEFLSANFAAMTIENCYGFIEKSNEQLDRFENITDIHYAIADSNDEYMGTVSLKHINHLEKDAEFAITIRKTAMGKGFSAYGMEAILKKGIEEFGLENIYWCVSSLNKRAVRFYEKHEYNKIVDVPEHIKREYSENLLSKLIWFVYSKKN